MDREQQLIAERERAHRAKTLLENEMLQAAFEEIHSRLLSEWEGTTFGQEEDRERLWNMLFALKSVKTAISKHIETGKLADAEIAQGPSQH